ncbi:MAG: tagaturonate reductase [Acidobacteriota bacterium]
MQLKKENIEKIINSEKIKAGPIKNFPERVIQFGEGNFLRAFIDWMFNELNKKNLFNGSVVVIQPLEQGLINLINEQDGLYTLFLRGVDQGQVIEKREIITSLSRGINPYENWDEYLALAKQVELRYVVSNTTEAGIEYVNTPYPESVCPKSYPAKLARFLYERYLHFNGMEEKGMLIIPCELIEANGTMLKKAILKHAEDWALPEGFKAWIDKDNCFFNTLVDRIVPGYPKEEVSSITKDLGYEDKLLDTGELFHFFVIEGDETFSRELPFTEAGLNVKWTPDQQPYRTRKVRILNGAHTLSVLAAYLSGKNTVKEMVDDDLFNNLIMSAVFNEIIPTLELPEKEKEEYALAVLERFGNPFIKHFLLSISLNSVSKFKVRVLPSLLKYIDKKGCLPLILPFSLASLIMFYRGKFSSDGRLYGKRGEENYEISDSPEVQAFFEKLWQMYEGEPGQICRGVLSNESFWGLDLTKVEGLLEATEHNLSQIINTGIIKTAEALLPEGSASNDEKLSA